MQGVLIRGCGRKVRKRVNDRTRSNTRGSTRGVREIARYAATPHLQKRGSLTRGNTRGERVR